MSVSNRKSLTLLFLLFSLSAVGCEDSAASADAPSPSEEKEKKTKKKKDKNAKLVAKLLFSAKPDKKEELLLQNGKFIKGTFKSDSKALKAFAKSSRPSSATVCYGLNDRKAAVLTLEYPKGTKRAPKAEGPLKDVVKLANDEKDNELKYISTGVRSTTASLACITKEDLERLRSDSDAKAWFQGAKVPGIEGFVVPKGGKHSQSEQYHLFTYNPDDVMFMALERGFLANLKVAGWDVKKGGLRGEHTAEKGGKKVWIKFMGPNLEKDTGPGPKNDRDIVLRVNL